MKYRVFSAVLATALIPILLRTDDALEQRVEALETVSVATNIRLVALETPTRTPKPPEVDSTEAEGILKVTIENKQWDPKDIHGTPSKYEENIWWDATYEALTLEKPARSIKGVLQFCDLFGEPKFLVQVTINKVLKPNGTVRTKGVGMEYNQFKDDHGWLRTHELKNMTFKFQVTHILYQDGTSKKFE